MSQFRFELDSLLKYRKHQLEQCQQLMAEILADQSSSLQEQQELFSEREETSLDMRQKTEHGLVNINAQAAARYYLAQIDGRLRGVDAQLSRQAQQLELCRQAIVQADMAVRALEQLREKRLKKHLQQEIKREDVRLQELWLGNDINNKIFQQNSTH